MKKTSKTTKKIIALMTAILMLANTSIIASANEDLQEKETTSQSETVTKKKVLPRKGSKVEAKQDYKTHTVRSIQFEFPASGETYEYETGNDLVYKDSYDHVKIFVEAYDKFSFLRIRSNRANLEIMRNKLLYGCNFNEKVEELTDKEGFTGLMYQRKEEDKIVYFTYLEGEDDILMLSISADQYGMAAAKEYNGKILSSIKKGKVDTRTIIKSPENRKIKAKQKYYTYTMDNLQLAMPLGADIHNEEVFQGVDWLIADISHTRFKALATDAENTPRRQKGGGFKHKDAPIYLYMLVGENAGLIPKSLSDRKEMVSDIYQWYTENPSKLLSDDFEISYRNDVPNFVGYQTWHKDEDYGEYFYDCFLFGKNHHVVIKVSTEEEGIEAAEEYYNKMISSIKYLNPDEVTTKKDEPVFWIF